MKHVQHIRGRWVARITVPEELRPILGMRELVAPLGADRRQAERQALGVLNRFHAILDEAREAYEANRPTLSSAAKVHFRQELETDDLNRQASPEVRAFMQSSRSVYASRLRLAVAGKLDAEEVESLIGYAADDLARRDLAPDVPRKALLKALAEIQLEALARFEDRDEGRVKEVMPAHPLLTTPDPQPMKPMASPSTPTGATLSDVLKAFHKERNAGGRSLAAKTMDEHRSAVRMFEEHLGEALPVRAITRKHVLDYKNTLLDTPTRYTLRFPGLTLPQAIRANAKRPQPYETLAPQTINDKWLSHLARLMEWASRNGYLDTNPARGVRVDIGSALHRERTRLPFTRQELDRMFRDPMFADPARYATNEWAMLLALHTGARSSSELARLTLAGVREEQGVLVFDLAGASKNEHSKRLVPVHADLIRLGLPAYVERLRKRGETRLFPDWQPEDKVNRWFLRTFLPGKGITDKAKVFHSFRHTLKTELARTGCSRELSDLITGHADQSVAATYVHDAPLKRMQAALDAVNFKLPIATLAGTKKPSR